MPGRLLFRCARRILWAPAPLENGAAPHDHIECPVTPADVQTLAPDSRDAGATSDSQGCVPGHSHTLEPRLLPYVCVPTRVVIDPAITAPALRVYALLASFADRDGWCWPSLRTLGEHLGMARPTVCGHITHLVTLGHVTKAERTLPSGLVVTAYRPLVDAPKKDAARAFKRGASRSGEPNGRSEKAPATVRTTRTMEVETAKQCGTDAARLAEAPAAPPFNRGGKLRPLADVLLELGLDLGPPGRDT